MNPAVVSVSTFSKEYHSLSFTHAFPESIDDAGIYNKMHGARWLTCPPSALVRSPADSKLKDTTMLHKKHLAS